MYFTDDCCLLSVSQLPVLLAITWINLTPWLISPQNNVSVYRSLAFVASNKYPGVSRDTRTGDAGMRGRASTIKKQPPFRVLSDRPMPHPQESVIRALCAQWNLPMFPMQPVGVGRHTEGTSAPSLTDCKVKNDVQWILSSQGWGYQGTSARHKLTYFLRPSDLFLFPSILLTHLAWTTHDQKEATFGHLDKSVWCQEGRKTC